jgi:DNA-binding CsgD family transcriptional regulator/predicted negative regulator of RcsB-dependent stress response
VLVGGEAGIGKTALVEWLADDARGQGAQYWVGRCHDLTQTPPYGPWRDALAQADRMGDVRRPSPFATGAEHNTPIDQSSLFERVRGLLAGAASTQPLVLTLEDVHWSDPASLELLRFIAHGIESLPVLLIATYRSDELAPREPLFALLPRLARQSRVERIDLGAIDAEATRSLVRQRYTLSAADEARLVAYLQLRADGNPLFITELLRTLETGRLLTPEADRWRLGELTQAPVPPLIRQIIEDRLTALAPETQCLLEFADAIGQEAPLDIWREASGASRDELLAAADLAVRTRLAHDWALPERIIFTHALVRDALYGRQPLLARQAQHLRIAESLAARADGQPSVVASHFALADDPRAIDWLIRAGEDALALYAARDAIAALDHAQELGMRFSRPLSPAAYRARAAAATLLGDFDRARRDHELALERGRATGDRHAEWQALLDLGMLWAERDYERTIGYYRAALDLARDIGDQTTLAYSLNRIANWHVNRDEPHVGTPLHEEALALFTAAGDRAGIAETLDFLGMSTYLDADFPRATAYCEQAITLFRELGDQQRLSSCLNVLAFSGGDIFWTAAPLFRERSYWLRAGEEALAVSREIGWPAGEAFALASLGNVNVTRGELGRALDEAREALDIAERIGHQQWTVAARLALAAAWIELLLPERALVELEQALVSARVSGSRFWTNTMVALLTSLHVSRGELTRAAAVLGTAILSESTHRSLSQRQCRFAAAELTLARGDAERALAMVDELAETRPQPTSDDPLPQLLKLRGDALTRLERFEDAETSYLAAWTGARLLEFRPMLWRIDLARGDLFAAQGRRAEAEDAWQRAQATVDEMAQTVSDPFARDAFLAQASTHIRTNVNARQALSNTRQLSPRELDVLHHLVQGKTDREIAAALSISPRTVMRHVTGILDKLDVSSRTAAATFAVREGLV